LLRQLLPALTRFYGLKPGDIEAMPLAELDAYVTQYLAQDKAQDKDRGGR